MKLTTREDQIREYSFNSWQKDMTTRQEIRNLVRRRLGDDAAPFQWSDLQINQWINDAIAEYSIHFPRRIETTLSCSVGMSIYDLPAGFRAAYSVEYPVGEDPPRYLDLRNHLSPGFNRADSFYNILRRLDESSPDELILSASPEASECICVSYLADHAYLDDDSDTCTILDRHLELLVMFVRWAAYQELATTESADPDPTNLALGTLELNAYRAKREYRLKLEQWQAAEAESGMVSWQMDRWDRVY